MIKKGPWVKYMNTGKNTQKLLVEMLAADGVHFDEADYESLEAYCRLIEEWNESVSLVSQGDLEQLFERHVVDSLSLAGILRRSVRDGGKLLDIGSGAGFPAIPLKIVLPHLHLVLVERSERKIGFLRKAVGDLGLSNVTIRHGEFPQAAADVVADAITARAVEDPKRLTRAILRRMPVGCTFLCQSGEGAVVKGDMFHVEHVDDAWTRRGLRRGDLRLIRRAS